MIDIYLFKTHVCDEFIGCDRDKINKRRIDSENFLQNEKKSNKNVISDC